MVGRLQQRTLKGGNMVACLHNRYPCVKVPAEDFLSPSLQLLAQVVEQEADNLNVLRSKGRQLYSCALVRGMTKAAAGVVDDNDSEATADAGREDALMYSEVTNGRRRKVTMEGSQRPLSGGASRKLATVREVHRSGRYPNKRPKCVQSSPLEVDTSMEEAARTMQEWRQSLSPPQVVPSPGAPREHDDLIEIVVDNHTGEPQGGGPPVQYLNKNPCNTRDETSGTDDTSNTSAKSPPAGGKTPNMQQVTNNGQPPQQTAPTTARGVPSVSLQPSPCMTPPFPFPPLFPPPPFGMMAPWGMVPPPLGMMPMFQVPAPHSLVPPSSTGRITKGVTMPMPAASMFLPCMPSPALTGEAAGDRNPQDAKGLAAKGFQGYMPMFGTAGSFAPSFGGSLPGQMMNSFFEAFGQNKEGYKAISTMGLPLAPGQQTPKAVVPDTGKQAACRAALDGLNLPEVKSWVLEHFCEDVYLLLLDVLRADSPKLQDALHAYRMHVEKSAAPDYRAFLVSVFGLEKLLQMSGAAKKEQGLQHGASG